MTKLKLSSKLPNEEDSIFSKMSRLAAEHNAINLSQGFPNFQTDETLKKLVTKYIETGFNQYALMAEVLDFKFHRLFLINFKRLAAPFKYVTGFITAKSLFFSPKSFLSELY